MKYHIFHKPEISYIMNGEKKRINRTYFNEVADVIELRAKISDDERTSRSKTKHVLIYITKKYTLSINSDFSFT